MIRVDRLAWVHQIPSSITYENGDQSDYLDLTFRCSWLEGEPFPVDGEMTEVGWFRAGTIYETSTPTCGSGSRSPFPERGEAVFI